jgi:hypothetical protein
MTLLELMIVLAIIAGIVMLTSIGFRKVSKGDLVDDLHGLTGRMKATSALAVETGVPHRVLIDFREQAYVVEACAGRAGLTRAKRQADLDDKADPEQIAELLAEAQQRIQDAGATALAGGVADPAALVSAIAGSHVGDQQCAPVSFAAAAPGEGAGSAAPQADQAARSQELNAALFGKQDTTYLTGVMGAKLNASSAIKFKEVHVQHVEESVREGQVAIYFFPDGSAEKAIVALTDGDVTYSVLVAGLTARIDIRDSEIGSPDDYMMRNPLGDEEAER